MGDKEFISIDDAEQVALHTLTKLCNAHDETYRFSAAVELLKYVGAINAMVPTGHSMDEIVEAAKRILSDPEMVASLRTDLNVAGFRNMTI